ncbi:MAG: polymorphic toxin-type HINT domain-containing protein [Pseudomonadota bacterium]
MAGLIAGTPVHTNQGLKNIEDIRVGDRVLAQTDVPGELVCRAVTNTFVREDKAIWVVKISFGDESPAGNKHYRMVYHVFATDTPSFMIDGKGWVSTKRLKHYERIRLASGEPAQVEQVWPVVRTPVEGLGWVSSDTLNSSDGIEERGHVVDFRAGCNLWKYEHLREDKLEGVPHFYGMFSSNFDTPFRGEDLYDIYRGDDPLFKARAYNLEVEGNGGYCVGELGVLFKSFRTPSEFAVLDQIEQGKRFAAAHDFAPAAGQFELAADGAESLALHSLASEAWRLRADVFRRVHDFPQAVETAGRAGHFARLAGDRSRLAQSLVVAGEALRALGRSDEAARTLASALAEAKAGGNPLAAGRAFYFQALLHDDAGRYRQCIDAAESAIIGASTAGDRVIADNALERKAHALKALGRHDEALAAFVEAHERCRADGNPILAALAWSGKAEVLGMVGRGAEARQTSDEALLAAQRTDDPIAIASVLAMRGELLERLEPAACVVEFLKAYHLADKVTIASIRQRAKAGLARTVRNACIDGAPVDADFPALAAGRKAFRDFDYEAALAHFAEAAAQAEVARDEGVAAKAAIGRSDALRRLDRRDESRAAADAAVGKAGALDDQRLRASAYLARAQALWTGATDEAVADCDAALHEARACGDRGLAAEALYNKAELLRMSQQYDEAQSLFEEGLDDAASAGAVGTAGKCFWGKGSLRLTAYEFEDALEYYDVAAILVEGNGDTRLAAYARYYKGYALQKLNRFQEAPAEYELALALAHRAGPSDLVAEVEKGLETCRSFFNHSVRPEAEPQHSSATRAEDSAAAPSAAAARKHRAESLNRKVAGTSMAIAAVLQVVAEVSNRAGASRAYAIAFLASLAAMVLGIYLLTRKP